MSEARPARAKIAFEEVVAEQRVLRHAAGERRLEGVDVVDALAGVGALAEQILVDVGDRRRVGIDAARRGEDALEERALAADRQRRRHARLQDAVAFDDAPAVGVEARPVERMRHLADQPARGVARQARVGVERDDVADAGGRRGAAVDGMNVVSAAPRSRRFSSWSLPRLRSQPIQRRSPSFQTRRRCSRRKRVAAGGRPVARVQARDARGRRREQRRVARDALRVGVGPVREQREVQLAVGVGEVVDLQPLDLLLERLARRSAGSARRPACAARRARRRAARGPAGSSRRRSRVTARFDERDGRVDRGDRRRARSRAPPARPTPVAARSVENAAARARPRSSASDRAEIAAEAERGVEAAEPAAAAAARKPSACSKARRPPAIR